MHKSPQATAGFCVCGGKFIYMQFTRECAYRADMESAPTVNHKFCNDIRHLGGVKTPPYGNNR